MEPIRPSPDLTITLQLRHVSDPSRLISQISGCYNTVGKSAIQKHLQIRLSQQQNTIAVDNPSVSLRGSKNIFGDEVYGQNI